MDFTAHVRHQRLDHQGELMHYPAGYVAFNLLGSSGRRLTANDINMLGARNISAPDILLSEKDFKSLRNGTHFGMYSVLHSYCGELTNRSPANNWSQLSYGSCIKSLFKKPTCGHSLSTHGMRGT